MLFHRPDRSLQNLSFWMMPADPEIVKKQTWTLIQMVILTVV